MSPYPSLQITPNQREFNTRMSSVQESVEWGFGEAKREFPFLDFARNMRLLLSPVGIFYLVGLLLCNAHTILHYPLVPQYFTCQPPTLEEYFSGSPLSSASYENVDTIEKMCPWVAYDEEDVDTE